MRLQCINTNNVYPGTLIIGNEYEITQMYPGCYTVDGVSVYLSNFESIMNRFKRLAKTANKISLLAPTKGTTVELLLTDKYIIVYAHTKGNHWNICGNHYRLYHNAETGEYVSEPTEGNKYILKERLLMKDYNELTRIVQNKQH